MLTLRMVGEALRENGSVTGRYSASLDRAVRAAGALSAVIGATYLAAWLSGAAARWSVAGVLTMKTNMAVSLLVAGVGLLLVVDPAAASPARRRAATIAGALVLLVGVLTLGEHLLRLDLGIDQLLASEDPGAVATASPNRVGLPGAASLALVGAGLILSAWRRRVAVYLGIATCVVVVVPAIGFLYGVSNFYSARGTGIAWLTVVALLSLGAGLALVDREGGPLAVVWRDDPGGVLLRRMLVPALLIPLVLGYVRVQGERQGLYGGPTGTALYAVVLILLLSVVLLRSAAQLSASATLRQRARDQLAAEKERADWLASFPARNPVPIAEVDSDGGVRYANAAAEQLFPDLRGAGSRHPWLAGWDEVVRVFREQGAPSHERIVVVAGSTYQQRMYFVPETACIRIYGADVTKGARAEAALRESEHRLRAHVTELMEAQGALQEANRRKDEFLAMLSHELRNPLAAIRNSVHILERVDPAAEQATRARGIVRRQADQLTRIVDDLLDVTRIARGKIELHRARVDLRELVARAASDLHGMNERNAAVRVNLPDAEAWADADATRIVQLVGNLLHNATKFTLPGDEITLSLRASGDVAEISVSDTGIGIDPALLPQVFDPFVQGERGLARTEGGLGLGLAVVKAVAELHGGTVRAESAGAGRGATFVVRLPLAPASSVGEPAAAPASRAGRRRRVLVVDDNRDAAESLAEIVKMLGHEAAIAFDGHGAIEEVRANGFDCVLCDIGLPGISGYDVARALRASHGRELRLIAVSGYAQPTDVNDAMEAGFDAHVAKPCDASEIERMLA